MMELGYILCYFPFFDRWVLYIMDMCYVQYECPGITIVRQSSLLYTSPESSPCHVGCVHPMKLGNQDAGPEPSECFVLSFVGSNFIAASEVFVGLSGMKWGFDWTRTESAQVLAHPNRICPLKPQNGPSRLPFIYIYFNILGQKKWQNSKWPNRPKWSVLH